MHIWKLYGGVEVYGERYGVSLFWRPRFNMGSHRAWALRCRRQPYPHIALGPLWVWKFQ